MLNPPSFTDCHTFLDLLDSDVLHVRPLTYMYSYYQKPTLSDMVELLN